LQERSLPQQQLQQALTAHRRGQLAQAEQLYRRLLRQRPGFPPANHYLGLCLFQTGRRDEGLKLVRAALAAQPNDLEMLGNLAQMQKTLGDLAGAEASYGALLEAQPDHQGALFHLSELLNNRQAFAAALTLLARLEAILPDDPGVKLAIGASLLNAGRPEEALRPLAVAAANAGLRAQAEHNRATALADLGRVDQAEAACDLALRANPSFAAAAWQKGLCRYDQGDVEGAQAAFTQALAANPQLDLARVYLAVLLSEQRQDRAARQQADLAKHFQATWRAQLYRRKMEQRQGAAIAASGFKTALLKRSYQASAPVDGLVLEFGVYTGRSLSHLANWHQGPIHGFDSFQGLPQQWVGQAGRKDYSTDGHRPQVPDHVTLVAGWFEDSLPGFARAQAGPIKFANIDCDLYSSTKCVFDHLGDRLVPGSVLVFDEYFGYDGWEEHEYKAFQELVARRGLSYDYLALCPFTRQAAVRITGCAPT
jgi:tetratricopeptide (TPR) repeat protein